jgi:DNA-directed RNA polymerase subunit RPC12/RpoP
MTVEKRKRQHFMGWFAFNQKLSRREARKIIRVERRDTKKLIKKGTITRKTRFVCNFCGAKLKLHEWLWERGAVIRCPKCNKEIMDIAFTDWKEL